MDFYIKNGIKLPKNKIVITRKSHNRTYTTYNPNHDLLISEGWKLYVPSDDIKLQNAKQEMINFIKNYDQSDNVNIFYIKNIPIWLDAETRSKLKLRIEAELSAGKTETILWYNNIQFPLQLNDAMNMLYKIEIYASQCYDNTQLHIANVNNLDDVNDVIVYDYKSGYPDKLHF